MRLAIVIGIACVLARNAEASCGGPVAELSPPGGSLPPRPTIYAFVPSYEADGTFESDVPLEVKLVATGWRHVYAVTVLADSGTVTVRHVDRTEKNPQPREATYQIAAPLLGHLAAVVELEHVTSSWMCSYTNVIAVETAGNAIAYRLDWHDGGPPSVLPTPLEIGHASCDWDNVDARELRGFDLVALFADGAERRIGSAKLLLDIWRIRPPVELVGDDHEPGVKHFLIHPAPRFPRATRWARRAAIVASPQVWLLAHWMLF